VPGYLGRVLEGGGEPAGTCFQVAAGVLVTAWHVLDAISAADADQVVGVDPLAGGSAFTATVTRVDPVHDLAVLTCDSGLLECSGPLAGSDGVALNEPVSVTGHCVPLDAGRTTRWLTAPGTWAAGTTWDDAVPVGRMKSGDLMPGMSGAPVIRHSDNTVVGVVSGRYNPPDNWLAGTVWVARCEDLAPLMAGLCDITIQEHAARAVDLVLTVSGDRVRLTGPGGAAEDAHSGVTPELADALRGLRGAREQLTGLRGNDVADPPTPRVFATPALAGQRLAEAFLHGPVADALAAAVAGAQERWEPVRLGIDAAGPLGALPWEALALPGTQVPAGLHPLVTVYRRQATGTPPARVSTGPLRIVVAISAPLADGGGVLDHERELRNVLAAVRGARQGQAQVEIVHFATTAEIRAALDVGPAHVLHLSGHGRPGLIELEDDDGNARTLEANQFVAEAIPPGKMPPVIALSACHTDAATSAESQSFASTLIGHGAAVVIGTETAVTDVYATRVFARIYGQLADTDTPDAVAAVAQARRIVQQQLSDSPDRRDQHLAQLGEWAVLSVRASAGSVIVFDPSQPAQKDLGAARHGQVIPGGLLARGPGEFVGRRRAQRRWPAALLAPGGSGLVLHGIGGVGKTTLAAELIRRITEREPERLPVLASSSLSGGQATVDQVLTAIARTLRRRSPAPGSILHQAAAIADRADLDWQARLEVLQEHVLGTLPLLIVLDNFEDNLTRDSAPGRPGWRTVADQDLGALLASLATRPDRCRLLITTRFPFALPGHADSVLTFQHVGPLTPAETMKLAWALPALDKLTQTELERVWQMVGGHPRCLEYVDALLSGGRSRYPDVTARLAANLATRPGISDPAEWLAANTTLEPALAETLTLAADDILLDQLLGQLRDTPGAEDLLLGLSVYRSPVDHAGLLFQAGTPDPAAEQLPDRTAANERISAILAAAGISPGPVDLAQLHAAVQQQLAPHLAELARTPVPPLRPASGLQILLGACTASSLLAADTSQGAPAYFVHRWTASELHARWNEAPAKAIRITEAHERAAAYWQWRVQVWPQDRASALDDLTEARHHLFTAGQPAQASDLTWAIASILHDRGAWDREDAIIRDTLAQLPDDADDRSNWTRQLGDIAQGRGRTEQAARLYQQALTIDQQHVRQDPANIGYQRDLSISYERLADLADDAGDTQRATELWQQAMIIHEGLVSEDPAETGHQRDLATSYERLGDLARDVGDTQRATDLYQQALAIREQLARQNPTNTGYQRGLAFSYNKLGDLARDAGDTQRATDLYQQALAIREQLARQDPTNTGYQRGLAISYNKLGHLPSDSDEPHAAAETFQRAIEFCTTVYGSDHPLVQALNDAAQHEPTN
jgi:tetratricopeptide (TPR) repeat protein